MNNDYINNPTEIVILANEKKCVRVYGMGRVPAAFVQNWQLRYVVNLIINKQIHYYHKKEKTYLFKKHVAEPNE